jgi:hypothetical protein
MNASKLNRAELIKELVAIRDRIDAALDILMPDDDEDGDCEHPAAEIEEKCEAMGEETTYTCKRCGEVRTVPFNHKE